MTQLKHLWTIFDFEFRRTLTWQRCSLAVALILFPVCLISLVQYQGARLEGDQRGILALFILIPGVLCVVGQLLWSTGLIQTELEEKTWTYLALRPVNRPIILIGKYLSAVVWTLLSAMASLVLCLVVLGNYGTPTVPALYLALLAAISTLAYGAVFALIGVLFPSRALVASVAYSAVMEAIVAWLPSAINRFSILYHLRCLFARWLLKQPGQHGAYFDTLFFGTLPTWQHVLLLIGITVALLAIAGQIVARRQFNLATEP